MSRPQTERLGASQRLSLRPALGACKIAPDNVVVRRVEQLFAFADQLEAKVNAAKARIDRLTQSILAKAFARPIPGARPWAQPAAVQSQTRQKGLGVSRPQTERLGASLRLSLRPALRACKIAPDNFVVRRVEQLFALAKPIPGLRPSGQPSAVQNRSRRFCRGELIPQDPSDEPASVLLERIQAQLAATLKSKHARKDA